MVVALGATKGVVGVDDADGLGARARAVGQWALYAVPVVAIAAGGWHYRWTSDDGFIYFRVVQQLRAGNGPVFNDGERVEAFTGVVWLGLLAIADVLTPVRLEWIAVVLGIASSAAGVAMAMAGARRLWPAESNQLFIPFGVLGFVALTPAWVYATAGLETGLCLAWLGGCFWILARWATASRRHLPVSHAVVLGLGWLVRPELALTSAAFLVLVLAGHRHHGRRTLLRVAAAVVALPLAYQLFRMAYYGALTTNPAIAKESSHVVWERGWAYFRDVADAYRLWIPGLILVVGGVLPLGIRLAREASRLPLLVVGCFVVTSLANGLYIMVIGGDFGHARLLLPALFGLCVPVAAVPVSRHHLAALLMVPYALVAATSYRPPQWSEGQFANGFVLPEAAGVVTRDDLGWGDDGQQLAQFTEEALYYQPGLFVYAPVHAETAPDISLPAGAFGSVGVSSYALGPEFHVIDLLGLGDPLIARFDAVPGVAGHEKPSPPSWLSARVFPAHAPPPADAFPVEGSPFVPADAGDEFWDEVATSREALQCGSIAELVEATTAPLSAGRAIDNLLGAFGRTTMRIPRDPSVALHELCDR